MSKVKAPTNRRRRGSPEADQRTSARLDQEASYAPPHSAETAGYNIVPPMVSAAVALPESLQFTEQSQTVPASEIEAHTVSNRLGLRDDGDNPTVHRQVALIQLRGLIAVFQEVQDYDPERHHNLPQPLLWIDDKRYLLDIKALVQELRRLNDILESGAANPANVKKSGSLVASLAEKVCHSAADVVGKGLGAIVVGSFALVLAEVAGVDLANVLLTASKGGK